MKVYAYWDSTATAPDNQAEMLRLWGRSWKRHGWEPRLLTINNARQSTIFQPSENVFDLMFFALQAVGGGWLTAPCILNRGFEPFRPKQKTMINPWTVIWSAAQVKRITISSVQVPLKITEKLLRVDSIQEALDSGLCH